MWEAPWWYSPTLHSFLKSRKHLSVASLGWGGSPSLSFTAALTCACSPPPGRATIVYSFITGNPTFAFPTILHQARPQPVQRFLWSQLHIRTITASMSSSSQLTRGRSSLFQSQGMPTFPIPGWVAHPLVRQRATPRPPSPLAFLEMQASPLQVSASLDLVEEVNSLYYLNQPSFKGNLYPGKLISSPEGQRACRKGGSRTSRVVRQPESLSHCALGVALGYQGLDPSRVKTSIC